MEGLYGSVSKVDKKDGILYGTYRFRKNSELPEDQFEFRASVQAHPELKKGVHFRALISPNFNGFAEVWQGDHGKKFLINFISLTVVKDFDEPVAL